MYQEDHRQISFVTVSGFLTDNIKLVKYQVKLTEKYTPVLHSISCFEAKLLVIKCFKSERYRYQFFYFLLFYINFYISKYHFSTVF